MHQNAVFRICNINFFSGGDTPGPSLQEGRPPHAPTLSTARACAAVAVTHTVTPVLGVYILRASSVSETFRRLCVCAGRRHISTSGLASSALGTFLFRLILVYNVVFRPEWPPYRPRRLGNRSGRPGSFSQYYFRFARRCFVAYSATPITPSVCVCRKWSSTT